MRADDQIARLRPGNELTLDGDRWRFITRQGPYLLFDPAGRPGERWAVSRQWVVAQILHDQRQGGATA